MSVEMNRGLLDYLTACHTYKPWTYVKTLKEVYLDLDAAEYKRLLG